LGQGGGVDAGGAGAAEGLAPDGFEFDFAAGEVVDEARGAVGAHGRGDAELFVNERVGDRYAVSGGGALDVVHERAGAGDERGIGADAVGGEAAGGDSEAVEGDVPDEFTPTGGADVVGELDADSGGFEGVGETTGAVGDGAGKFAEDDEAGAVDGDFGGGGSSGADDAEGAENALGADEGGEVFVGAEAVLDGEDGGVGVEERGEESGEGGVGGGLECDEDEVDGPDVGGVGEGGDGAEFEGLVVFDEMGEERATGAHGGEVAAEEETDVVAGEGETGAVEESEGAGTEDGDGHGEVRF